MTVTKKQAVAIAAIILLGLLATAGVLLGGRAGEAHHDEGGTTSTNAEAPHAGSSHAETGHEDTSHAEPSPAKPAADAITLSKESRDAASIEVGAAGPGSVRTTSRFPGEIRFNEDRTAHVVPRVSGVAESVPVTLGQTVKKGQVLAVIASTALAEQRSELLAARQRLQLARSTHEREKKLWEEKISAEQDYLQARTALQEAEIAVRNAASKLSALGAPETGSSLNRFAILAPFDGTITTRHISLGEAVQDTATVFTISDLRTVWAEFAVSAKDIAQVRVGATATVSTSAFDGQATGTVSYVGQLLGEQTRTAQGRILLANPALAWRPGLFVTVAISAEPKAVPIAVGVDAVQTLEDRPVVFVETPTGFVARRVTVGASDGQQVEIREGLAPGERHATRNSFVLKAELGKGSAEHAH